MVFPNKEKIFSRYARNFKWAQRPGGPARHEPNGGCRPHAPRIEGAAAPSTPAGRLRRPGVLRYSGKYSS